MRIVCGVLAPPGYHAGLSFADKEKVHTDCFCSVLAPLHAADVATTQSVPPSRNFRVASDAHVAGTPSPCKWPYQKTIQFV